MGLINGDLIPSTSGHSHLGIDTGTNGPGSFDISTLTPFGHVVMLSGILLDPILGQSGVIRYSRQAAAIQISVDGGLTFNDLVTGATTVTSVGVIGGANLTGNIDLATHASGFLAITDTAGASPLVFSVDHLGLSGLWQFPTQGFNGRVVNALTDFNGTEAQGVINVVGTSGIVADIIGTTLTITPGPSGGFATGHVQAFASANIWTVTHNLNTPHVVVSVWDNADPCAQIIPDRIRVTTPNVVVISFNTPQAGKVVVLGCKNIF
jgi:hypothetical protein